MDEKNVTVRRPEEEEGISFRDLWMVLKKYLWQIVVLTCLLTLVAGVLCKVLVKTKYTAQAVIILNPSLIYMDDSNSSTTNEILADRYAVQYGKELIPSVISFIQTSNKIKNAINEASSQSENIESLKNGTLNVTNAEDELQLVLTYTTATSADTAKETLNKLVDLICSLSDEVAPQNEGAEAAPQADKIQYIYPWANTLNVDDYAEQSVASNKWALYTFVALLLGFVLSYVYYLTATMMDDTIKSKTVIENISGFHVIAYIEELEAEKTKHKKISKAAKGK